MGFFSDLFHPSKTSKSSTTSSSTTDASTYSAPAAFTPYQEFLQRYSVRQGGEQTRNLVRAGLYGDMLKDYSGDMGSALDDLGMDQATEATQRAMDRGSQLDDLFASELARINQGAEATPEQKALIGEVASNRIAAGSSDIQAALEDSLGLLRSELAPSRGFRPEDTPIQDRGQVLAKESLRLTRDLVNEARAEEAQQLLDYPLRENALRSAQTQELQKYGLNEASQSLSLQQFQNTLRSEDFKRRLAAGQYGLDLASLGPQNVGQFTSPGQVTTSTSSSTSGSVSKGRGRGMGAGTQGLLIGLEQGGQIGASFAGGFGQGLGGAMGGAMASSRSFKENGRPIDIQDILNKFEHLIVEKWNYKDYKDEDFIGPYAEDFKELFDVGNSDKTINLVNANGVVMAAIKALLQRVNNLEEMIDGGRTKPE